MPYGQDDPFTAQLRAAQSMQAMKQVAGYPYMPFSSQATGYEPQSRSRDAANMIGGVFNAWIGKKANDYMNEQKEAESVFKLAQLGYDLGDLLADGKKRKAVEKYLGITLPQSAEGDYGPQSIERIQQNMRRAILKDERNQQTLATVLPAAQQAPPAPVAQGQPDLSYVEAGVPSPAPGAGALPAATPAPGQALAPGQVPPIAGVQGVGPVAPGMDDRMRRMLAADPQHQGRMEELRQQGLSAVGAATARGQYDVAREQMRQTMAFTKAVGDNAQQLFRDYNGTLSPGAATNMAQSLITGREPEESTYAAFQNAMSPQQQDLQKKYMEILKESFPQLTDNPRNLAMIAGMSAQGKDIPVEMLPHEVVPYKDPETGETSMVKTPYNFGIKMAVWNLQMKKLATEYTGLQVGQLNQLLTTPSKVMVPGRDGKPIPLPMSIARDHQMIEESMERVRASQMDIRNVDALVTLLKSTAMSPADRSVLLRTLAEQMRFKSADDPGFLNWYNNYNQWRVLPPAGGGGFVGGTGAGGPVGPAPAGPPQR